MKVSEDGLFLSYGGTLALRRFGLGCTFDCPHCFKAGAASHTADMQRLAIFFANPLDNGPSHVDALRTWHRTGGNFDELTLTPSIDCSAHGHWHGTITDGEVT